MPIQAGRLRHRITVQQRELLVDSNGDVVQDQNGQEAYSWGLVAELWAAIEPLSAREFIAAQSSQSKVIARITIRQRDDIHHGMRILHLGKVYQIEGILQDPVSGLEYSTLPVSQGVNDTGE